MNLSSLVISISMLITHLTQIQFLSLLDLANLIQHVQFPMHRYAHTLDLPLVLTLATSTLSPVLTCLPVSPTDHFPIICSLNITPPPRAPIIKRLSRAVTSIDASKFSHDILSSRIIRHILLLLFLILSTAITLLCLNFSTNMHLSSPTFFAQNLQTHGSHLF